MAGWSCAYVNDNNEGNKGAGTSTSSHEHGTPRLGHGSRASHGILKFQEAMDSILEEEQRIMQGSKI